MEEWWLLEMLEGCELGRLGWRIAATVAVRVVPWGTLIILMYDMSSSCSLTIALLN